MGGAGIVCIHVGNEHTMKHWSRVAALACGIILHVGAAPALAAGPGGGGGGGGAGGGGGGGGTVPVLVNYKITGTVSPEPGCANGTLGSDVCQTFVPGSPFTLTYTVNLATTASLQNATQPCATNSVTNTFLTTKAAAVYSKAVTNFNLQLASGVSYVAPDADITIENDVCLAGGVQATDLYQIYAKSVTPVVPPGIAPFAANTSFALILADQATVGLTPLVPPTALTSLNLATAAPEAHLLEYNVVSTQLLFRFATVGFVTFHIAFTTSTLEIVP